MAREHAPSIIFMDEIDSIGSSRVEGFLERKKFLLLFSSLYTTFSISSFPHFSFLSSSLLPQDQKEETVKSKGPCWSSSTNSMVSKRTKTSKCSWPQTALTSSIPLSSAQDASIVRLNSLIRVMKRDWTSCAFTRERWIWWEELIWKRSPISWRAPQELKLRFVSLFLLNFVLNFYFFFFVLYYPFFSSFLFSLLLGFTLSSGCVYGSRNVCPSWKTCPRHSRGLWDGSEQSDEERQWEEHVHQEALEVIILSLSLSCYLYVLIKKWLWYFVEIFLFFFISTLWERNASLFRTK